MNRILLTGFAAVAVVLAASVAWLPRPSGPGVQVAPTPSASQTPGRSHSPAAPASPTPAVGACGLITTGEAAATGPYGAGTGATSVASGSGAVTDCQYTGGDVFLTLTLTKPGGNAAFDLVKATPGVRVIADLGADRGGGLLGADGVFDPASVTLYVSKGDALVAIHAGAAAQSSASRLAVETTIARIVVGRM